MALKYALVHLVGINESKYDSDPVVIAFNYFGIHQFKNDFLGLSKEDIENLTTNGVEPVPLLSRRRLQALLALYHHACTQVNSEVSILRITRDVFEFFRTATFDPSAPIVTWTNAVANSPDEKEKQLIEWRKIIKPSKADYKDFRDDATWNSWKEFTTNTMQGHGLCHLIDPTYVPKNPDLHTQQSYWMYNVLEDKVKTSIGRTIIKQHMSSKNVLNIWMALCGHYDQSIAAELKAQSLSTYITSTRLATSSWRGTYSAFLSHFLEQLRLYDEVAREPYTEQQKIQFLNTSMIGVAKLEDCLTNLTSARKASGNTTFLKLEEYVQNIQTICTVHDNGQRMTARGPIRSSNTHQFEHDTIGMTEYTHEDEAHDIDTSIETFLDVNKANRRSNPVSKPRKVFLSRETWNKLSKQDQLAWDTVSEDGKNTILDYVTERRKRIEEMVVNPSLAINTHRVFENDSIFSERETNLHHGEKGGEQNEGDPKFNIPTPTNASALTQQTKTSHIVGEGSQERQFDINMMLAKAMKPPDQPVDIHTYEPSRKDNGKREIRTHEFNWDRYRFNYDDDDTVEDEVPTAASTLPTLEIEDIGSSPTVMHSPPTPKNWFSPEFWANMVEPPTPDPAPGRMSGQYSLVDKPERLMDRIIPSGDGKTFFVAPEKKVDLVIVSPSQIDYSQFIDDGTMTPQQSDILQSNNFLDTIDDFTAPVGGAPDAPTFPTPSPDLSGVMVPPGKKQFVETTKTPTSKKNSSRPQKTKETPSYSAILKPRPQKTKKTPSYSAILKHGIPSTQDFQKAESD
jgi:hypothetical protein